MLQRDADELATEAGVPVEIAQDGAQVYVMLRDFPLPAGVYVVASSDILFLTDVQYPLSAMDMFWTDPAVVRADGSVPTGAESVEVYGGRSWRRFSWHRNGVWSPNGNPLLDHFEFMQDRFLKDVVK